MKNKVKIFIVINSGSLLLSSGLGGLLIFFNKPMFLFTRPEEDNEKIGNFDLQYGMHTIKWWSFRSEPIKFTDMFDYETDFANYIWSKICEFYGTEIPQKMYFETDKKYYDFIIEKEIEINVLNTNKIIIKDNVDKPF